MPIETKDLVWKSVRGKNSRNPAVRKLELDNGNTIIVDCTNERVEIRFGKGRAFLDMSDKMWAWFGTDDDEAAIYFPTGRGLAAFIRQVERELVSDTRHAKKQADCWSSAYKSYLAARRALFGKLERERAARRARGAVALGRGIARARK